MTEFPHSGSSVLGAIDLLPLNGVRKVTPLLQTGFLERVNCLHRSCPATFQFVNGQRIFAALRHRGKSDAIVEAAIFQELRELMLKFCHPGRNGDGGEISELSFSCPKMSPHWGSKSLPDRVDFSCRYFR